MYPMLFCYLFYNYAKSVSIKSVSNSTRWSRIRLNFSNILAVHKLQKRRDCLVKGKLISFYYKLFKHGHNLKVKHIVQWNSTRWSRIRLNFSNILSRSQVIEKTRLRGHWLITFVL